MTLSLTELLLLETRVCACLIYCSAKAAASRFAAYSVPTVQAGQDLLWDWKLALTSPPLSGLAAKTQGASSAPESDDELVFSSSDEDADDVKNGVSARSSLATSRIDRRSGSRLNAWRDADDAADDGVLLPDDESEESGSGGIRRRKAIGMRILPTTMTMATSSRRCPLKRPTSRICFAQLLVFILRMFLLFESTVCLNWHCF